VVVAGDVRVGHVKWNTGILIDSFVYNTIVDWLARDGV
jgi:hypothetical protein